MRRILMLSALLLSAPALFAQSESGFVPPEGFRMTGTAANYVCTSGSTDARCASTAIPGNLTAANAPQFLLIAFDDCMTTETEGFVRSMLTPNLKNPDGRPVPATYFLSLEGCPGDGGESEHAVIQQRYRAGDEIAVHTRTHTTGTTTSLATWKQEMNDVRNLLRSLGLGADAGRGFRAPFLATNAAMYQALDDLDFLYDSSVYESPFWSPVSTGTGQFIWPFTYDSWSATAPAQACAGWSPDNVCPSKPVPGLWQMPLYYYVGGTQDNGTFYGVFDIGDPSGSGYNKVISGTSLTKIYQDHLTARLTGNRAPMTMLYHPYSLGNVTRANVYSTFMGTALARGDVWAVTMQGLIEWMKAPVPNSQMKAWYNSYCQRHPCSAPTTGTAAEDVSVATTTSALQASPSPARGPVTLTATATAPGAVLTVHDALGREVYRTDVPAGAAFRQTLDLSREAAGVYFARFTDGGNVTTRAVVVQR